MNNYPDVIARLDELTGAEPLVTDWMSISQIETDVFAALTRDRALMHNDPVWAAKSPWGGTIVHGYHVLSMLPAAIDVLPIPAMDDDRSYAVNYGLNRVRILNPLRVGHRFRIHTAVRSIDDKGGNRFLITLGHTVEVQGEAKPFLVAEALVYFGIDQNLGQTTQLGT